MKRDNVRRSPLRRANLPLPGSSTQWEAIDRQFTLIRWAMAAVMFAGIAIGYGAAIFTGGVQWFTLALYAAIAVGLFIWIFRLRRRTFREVDDLILGFRGERAVGEALGELVRDGYRIFHDIPSQRDGGANIDHLAVGPGGIFVIETKTRSKPVGWEAKVTYDGSVLRVNMGVPERDPIAQVRAVAAELADWLRSCTGRDWRHALRPVVVFPGWYVEDSRGRPERTDVWLQNEKQMVQRIRTEWQCFTPEDVERLAALIDGEVRAHQRRIEAEGE